MTVQLVSDVLTVMTPRARIGRMDFMLRADKVKYYV